MNLNTHPPRPPRQAVLVLSHGDGHVEAFADKGVDVLIARVPLSQTREGERLAEDCLELSLPQRYRDLYRADRLRANGTTRPLSAEAAHAALLTGDALEALDRLSADDQEAMQWTL